MTTRKKREVWVMCDDEGEPDSFSGRAYAYRTRGHAEADTMDPTLEPVLYVPAPTKKKPKKWSDIRRQRISDDQHEQIRREVVDEIVKKKPKRRAR